MQEICLLPVLNFLRDLRKKAAKGKVGFDGKTQS